MDINKLKSVLTNDHNDHMFLTDSKKKELNNFILTLNQEDIKDYFLVSEKDIKNNNVEKIKLIEKFSCNLSSSLMNSLSAVLDDENFIKFMSNHSMYQPQDILNASSYLSRKDKEEFLKRNIDFVIKSTNPIELIEENKKVVEILNGKDFIANINSSENFQPFYILCKDYLDGENDKVLAELLQKEVDAYLEEIFSIDKYKKKSIDLFFMDENWFSKRHTNKYDNKDGVDFLLDGLNRFATDTSLDYVYKKLNEELDKKEFLDYLNNREYDFLFDCLTTTAALPTASVMLKLFKLDRYSKYKTDKPILMNNVSLMFENNFVKVMDILINKMGVESLFGNKEEQKSIASQFMELSKSRYFFKNNQFGESGPIKEIGDIAKKLKIILKGEEIDKDFSFIINILSEIEDSRFITDKCFDIENNYNKILEHSDTQFMKLLFSVMPEKEAENIKNQSRICYEKAMINKGLTNNFEENKIKKRI